MESEFKKLQEQVMTMQRELDALRGDYYKDNYPSKIIFRKDVEMQGTFTQATVNPTTSFGLGVTPVGTQSAIANPSGGSTIDTECRNAVITMLGNDRLFGFINP